MKEAMPYDFQKDEPEPNLRACAGMDKAGTKLDVPTASNGDETIGKDAIVVTSQNEKFDAYTLREVLSLLKKMGVLDNKKLCLKLVAHLTESVGYQCAGYSAQVTVAELMLMSTRASELTEQLDQVDPT